MRTLALGTKIICAVALAAGLIMALGLPWYGDAPRRTSRSQDIGELHGDLQSLFEGIGRWFADHGGISGWTAMSQLDAVLAACAVLAIASALACLAGATEHAARAALQTAAVAAFSVVFVRLVDQPGSNALLEPRYGLFVALACATGLVIVSKNIAEAKLRRKPPARMPYRSAGAPR